MATKQQKEQVLALAQDLPRLWHAPSTSKKDRKRILRLLIKDITVDRLCNEQKAVLHIRWQTNATEDLEVQLPQKSYDRWRHSEDIINRIRQLAGTMTDEQIVSLFNQEGLMTNRGFPFTIDSIQWIRSQHNIPALCNRKCEEESSVPEVAKKFNVSKNLVYYWIQHKFINARRAGTRLWVSIGLEHEMELKKRVESSSKIAVARLKSQKQIEGGVL